MPEPSLEGAAVTASATFSDPGTADTFTCKVSYGDGSAEVDGTVTGHTCTGPQHTYVDNTMPPETGYLVKVTVTDKDGGVDDESTTHRVNNVAPTVATPVIVPEPSLEGAAVTASATFSDPGTADTFTCKVSYGDGSAEVDGTVTGHTCTGPQHTYVDNTMPPETGYLVKVTVTDKDGGVDDESTTHRVNNVAPTVATPVVVPEPSLEGAAVTASATFTDPGVNDAPFTCKVNYGDGTAEVNGTVTGSPTTGYTCAGPSHTYADNATPEAGGWTVTFTVTDKDGGVGSKSTSHVVKNVAPAATISLTTQTAQYSDHIAPVTITATDMKLDPLALTTQWKLGSGGYTAGLPGFLEPNPPTAHARTCLLIPIPARGRSRACSTCRRGRTPSKRPWTTATAARCRSRP